MSFPRDQIIADEQAVQQTVGELNKLCAVAFLKYADQLNKVDADAEATLKNAKKAKEEANDEIDRLIKNQIQLDKASPTYLKELKDTKDMLRKIIDKFLKKIPLDNNEQEILKEYKIDATVLNAIAAESQKLDTASNTLFSSPMRVPNRSDESSAARQTLLSHITLNILMNETDHEKSRKIEHWINVMDAMLQKGNYYGAYVVMSALNDAKIRETTAMSVVTESAQQKLNSTIELFGKKDRLEADMRQKEKDGIVLIPSLHGDEGSLVGCAESFNTKVWNSIIDKLTGYQVKLAQQGNPDLSGGLAERLINGEIGYGATLTQEMQSKTIASMIAIPTGDTTSKVKSEGYLDVISVRGKIYSILETLQIYVDTKKALKKSSPVITKRTGIMSQLIAMARKSIASVEDIFSRKRSNTLKKMIDTALNDQSVTTHVNPTNKGETRSHAMIRQLGEEFETLNRKVAAVEVIPIVEATMQAEQQTQPAAEVTVAEKLPPENPAKPVPLPMADMLREFSKLVKAQNLDPNRKMRKSFSDAVDILMEGETDRATASLSAKLPRAEDITNYFRDQQLEISSLNREIKQAQKINGFLNIVKANVAENSPAARDFKRLELCFHEHLQHMLAYAKKLHDPAMVEAINKMISNNTVKLSVTAPAPVNLDTALHKAKEQKEKFVQAHRGNPLSEQHTKEMLGINNDIIKILTQQRNASEARNVAAPPSDKGKEDVLTDEHALQATINMQIQDLKNENDHLRNYNPAKLFSNSVNAQKVTTGRQSEMEPVTVDKPITKKKGVNFRSLFTRKNTNDKKVEPIMDPNTTPRKNK